MTTRKEMLVRHAIEAVIQGGRATAQIMHVEWFAGYEIELEPHDCWRLELSINPRWPGTEAQFPASAVRPFYRKLGRFFALPPGHSISVRATERPGARAPGPQKSIVCWIATEETKRWLGEREDDALRATDLLDLRNQNLRGLLMRLANELENQGPASIAVVDAMATLIAIELSRHLLAALDAPPRGGLAARRLRLIDERIAAPGPAPSISELADLCRLSVRHLMRGFQVSHGVTLGAHIQAARLAKAQRMLMDGTATKEIAHTLGFASSASFCTTFKRQIGVSPGEYRRRT